MKKTALFISLLLALTLVTGCITTKSVQNMDQELGPENLLASTIVSTTTTSSAKPSLTTVTSLSTTTSASTTTSTTLPPTTLLLTTSTSTTSSSTSTSTSTEVPSQSIPSYNLDIIYKSDNTPRPSWLVDNFEGSAPWDGAVYMSTSADGLSFSGEKLFIDRAGVPNLLFTSDNRLIATFQYFSFKNQDMFDVIAYTVSEDLGKTWSPVNKIYFTGLGKFGPGSPNPVDPTLVERSDGSFRLYFTFQEPGIRYPGLYSAKSKTLDGPFQNEGPQLKTEKRILDPAVINYKGIWHHYTVRHDETQGGHFVNVHSTSDSGLGFALKDDIVLDIRFLGQVIEDDGMLRFYGSGDGVKSATSTDGYGWAMDPGTRGVGADPGVAKLPDGTYLMLYTKVDAKN